MPILKLSTTIKANKEQVFDLARSVEVHEQSTAKTKEKAIAGKTTGLMELHDTVTWSAKHLGIYQTLTVKITQYNRPDNFTDEMVKWTFKYFIHEHHFTQEGDITTMTDVFLYKSPLGILGNIADVLFLKRYMTKFLKERNKVIKEIAEGQIN